MDTLSLTLLMLGAELLAGTVVVRLAPLPRTWRARLRRAELRRGLRRAAPWATGITLTALAWMLVSRQSLPRLDSSILVVAFACGCPASCGAVALLAAGLEERRGRLARARRLVRSGGLLLCAGALGVLLASTALTLTRGAAPPWRWWNAGATATAGAAMAGLLAGLSGKPRPTGQLASGLYLIARWALVVVLH